VQTHFVGHSINRRKLYPADVRDVLLATMALRKAADYSDILVTATRIARMLRRGRVFVQAVRAREETAP